MSIFPEDRGIAEPPERRIAEESDRRDLTRENPGRRAVDRERTAKARCPICGHGMSHVISHWDYRPYYDEDIQAYVRYRQCDQCSGIYWTREAVGGACRPK